MPDPSKQSYTLFIKLFYYAKLLKCLIFNNVCFWLVHLPHAVANPRYIYIMGLGELPGAFPP